ncbi:MAG: SDR family NAD(P)-dependent oxidoreductase [Clostridia bacterium]|nr:SDR family NAD(P)-dependent oxidoreductase [Clostridia bacterium]
MITGKKIVLTGANSGIGLETLKLLVKGDNKILAVDMYTEEMEKFDKSKVTVYKCDVSTKEAVDELFEEAIKVLGKIDIFYANAGYPYYERMNYVDWDRVKDMFDTNVFSPIYTTQKYAKYLEDNKMNGHMAITVSAIGTMAMPGFTIYSASKFAMQGFQEGYRLELPKNMKLTCLYPIATATGFFKRAALGSGRVIQDNMRPFPVQQPSHVAKCMVKGIEKGKKKVNPSKLMLLAKLLFAICPPLRSFYWHLEYKKLEKFEAQPINPDLLAK